MPADGFGREIDYLRISLTDHCNLRCVYCMPISDPVLAPDEHVLSASEIELVVRAATSIGFRKFRLTGGEPTLRADLLEVVERVARVPGVQDLAMTTNGLHLPKLARPLKAAGLRRANVHLDSLDEERLPKLMRFGQVAAIWQGILAAEEAGLAPLKVNVVVVKDGNEDEVVELARLAVEHPWHVRFIELMPLGPGECAGVAVDRFVSNVQTKAAIEAALGPLVRLATHRADESKNFRPRGGKGVVGFISPVSEPYCGTCNRMRLTADGRFHLCLLNDDELDVRAAIRDGRGEAAVAAILRHAVAAKPTGHALDKGVTTRDRRMHAIGG